MTPETITPQQCERCHRESANLVHFMNGGTSHRICGDCLHREDKRINLKGEWRREGQKRRKG